MDKSSLPELTSADSLYAVFLKRRKQAEEDVGQLVGSFMYRFTSGIRTTNEMLHPVEYFRYTESKDFLFKELKAALVHCFSRIYTGLSKEYIAHYSALFNVSAEITYQSQWKDILAMTEFYMSRYVRFIKDSIDGLATDAMIKEKKNGDLIIEMNQKQRLFIARINLACHMLALYFCNSLASHINSIIKQDGLLVDVESRQLFQKSGSNYRLPENKKHSFVWKKNKGSRVGAIPPSRFKGKEIIIPSTTKNTD